jgi:hypothetical protein
MKRVLVAGAVLAAVAAVVGQATAAQSSGTIAVRLPKHFFGNFRPPDARVVSAKWGKGPGQVGLEKESFPTGASSFDVVNDVVCVLDQHNGRVLAYAAGKAPRAIPLVVKGLAGEIFRGVNSSLAVGTDGTIYVLEGVDSIHNRPTLRAFPARGGAPIATTSQGGAESVRAAGKTAYVDNSLVGPWQQVMKAGRIARARATPYRVFADGSRVQLHPLKKPYNKPQPWVVSMTTTSGKHLTWSVSSPDGIQAVDAESFGGIELLLVLNVYTDTKNEYEVLILGPSGILTSFSVPWDRYTETNLDDDFRVDGSTLYHLGWTKSGVYVDYYSF